MNSPDRLDYLRSRTELTDAEMAELVSLSAPGDIVSMPDLSVAGLKETRQALANLLEVNQRLDRARAAGFFVEALALRSQLAELFLRLYLGAKTGKSVAADDRRPLGALIDAADGHGLGAVLVERLRSFNMGRRAGLHHYLLGAAVYAALADVLETSDGMIPDLVNLVSHEFGIPLRP